MRKKMGKISLAAIGLGLLTLGASSARADLLLKALSTGDDTLFQNNANNSLGDPVFFSGMDSNNSPKIGLMAFNISAIPSYATITSATLDLWIGMVAGSGGGNVTNFGPLRTISVYDESQAWGASANETGSTAFAGHGQGFGANNGDATWDAAAYNLSNPSQSTAWTSGSAANITGSSTPLATTSGIPGTDGAEVQWTSTALATEVQGWVDTPSSDNGLAIVNSTVSNSQTFLAFWSASGSANNGNGLAPNLVVTYTVPEPVSLSLVAMVAPILLCRRQRRALS